MENFTTVNCPDYEDVESDKKAVDWDTAFKEVEDNIKAQEVKTAKETDKQKTRQDNINKKLREQYEAEFER